MSTGAAGSPGATLDRASRDVRRILDGALAGGEVSVRDAERLAQAAGRDLLALTVTADELRRRQAAGTGACGGNPTINFTNACRKHAGFPGFAAHHPRGEVL